MNDQKDIELANPTLIAKLEQAAEILSYIGTGMSVSEACKAVGIEERTYYNWIKQGIFKILIGDRIQEIQQLASSHVAENWPQIVENIVAIAVDKEKKAYPRDILSAAEFLRQNFVQPAADAQPDGTSAEEEYLKKKENKLDWSPALNDGQKIIMTIEKVAATPVETVDSPEVIDVTPKEPLEGA